ncbi:MAG: acetyl-CoA carboxylase carboxyl transferase subunit alpha, partial [Planctomycetota bacterium]
MSDLEAKVLELEKANDQSAESAEKIRELKRQLTELTREIYSDLSPWQTVQVARHKDRPHTTDYLSLVFDEFVELHGDKLFGDDRAIRVGFATLDGTKVLVLGHQKGRTFKDRTKNFFGCAHP